MSISNTAKSSWAGPTDAHRAKELFYSRLEQVIRSTQVELRHRDDALEILKFLLSEEELFHVCFNVWESGVGRIENDYQYDQCARPVIRYLLLGKSEEKESVRDSYSGLWKKLF